MNKVRIGITGIGPIASLGIGKDELWRGLIDSKVNIRRQCLQVSGSQISYFKHIVDNFDIASFGIDNHLLEELKDWKEGTFDKDLNFLLAAAKLALDDSKLVYNKKINKIGLIVAHENPGLEQYFSTILDCAYNFFADNLNKKQCYFHYMFEHMAKKSFELQTFMPLFHIAKILGLHGYTLFINNACASGAFAIEEATQVIRSGKAKVVVITAADAPDVYKYLWFEKLNLYSKDGIMRPFCSDANGFIFGDGAAGLVLEDWEHAKARAATIYAEYLGGSFLSEGRKVSLPNIDGDSYSQVMNESLARSDVSLEEVDLIVPHGVANRLNDSCEARAITQIINKNNRIKGCVLKPYVGHTLGANVLLELVLIIMMMKHQSILPLLNRDGLEHDLHFCDGVEHQDITIALKTTCAFAGFYSSFLIKNFH